MIYDLIIIGAGPAGQTAAIYASRARLAVLWLENRFVQGGQAKDSALMDNYPGLPGISGEALSEAFAAHAEKLGMTPVREKAVSITEAEGGLKKVCTKKAEYLSRTVIYAGGAVHRKLCIPGEEELSGAGVSYCATCDGAFFKDQDVAVVGGGNTACEEALFLSGICRKVYLIHRRDTFRADPILAEQTKKKDNIEILWNTVPEKICGTDAVEAVLLRSTKEEKEPFRLPVEGIFVAVGMEPESAILKELVRIDESGYVVAGESCETDCPGIYAAGDVRTKPLRQVITAAADGASAVASACRFLRRS